MPDQIVAIQRGALFKNDRVSAITRSPANQQPALIIWFIAISIFLPRTIAIFVDGLFLFPGRVCIILLIIPALLKLMRKIILCDFLMMTFCSWMFLSVILQDQSVIGVGAEALEIFGAYVLARAYLDTYPSIMTFFNALMFVTSIIVVIA